MNTTKSFAQRCSDLYNEVWLAAQPFVPTLAELETAAQPFVDELAAMDKAAAEEYIRATFKPWIIMPLVLKLYKDRVGRRWRPKVEA